MEYKVGDRVRHQEYGDGTVIELLSNGAILVDFGKDGGHCNWYFADCYSEEKWNLSSLTPIPSTISTEQMIKALMGNPKLRAETDNYSVCVRDGILQWGDDSGYFPISSSTMRKQWTLIYPTEPKQVDFLTAANSNKRIMPVDDGWAFDSLDYWLSRMGDKCKHVLSDNRLKYLNGKWLIKED